MFVWNSNIPQNVKVTSILAFPFRSMFSLLNFVYKFLIQIPFTVSFTIPIFPFKPYLNSFPPLRVNRVVLTSLTHFRHSYVRIVLYGMNSVCYFSNMSIFTISLSSLQYEALQMKLLTLLPYTTTFLRSLISDQSSHNHIWRIASSTFCWPFHP